MAKLSPIGNNAQFINGVPAVGAKIFTYAAGSSTKQTTYTDEAGTIPQTNPIILDSRGEPTQPIWLTEGLSYKFVFAASTDSDPPVSPIWDIDNVTGINDASLTIDQWVDSGVTPTYVSATSFTVPGDQTTAFHNKRRFKALVTAGTVYGTIFSSVFGALTTVTVVMDSTPLDSGLSSIQLSLLTYDNSAIPSIVESKRATVAANATTTPLWDSTAQVQDWTGAVTITNFPAAPRAGAWRVAYPEAGTILTDNANIDVQGDANYTTRAGDRLYIEALTTSTFKVFINTKNGNAVTSSTASQKIQPITASVAANALTLTLNPTTLDFRSTTAGSGTITTVSNAAAISTVISSGSTGGTVSAVKSRIMVLAINNAGTMELAWCNYNGSALLDESTLISTTAEGGAGAADSANIIYSTTARANVAFRIVGFVESTQATAGTWATAPSLIQGDGGINSSYKALDNVMGAAVATTAGTSVTIASDLPSWVKQITMQWASGSTSGTSVPIIQLGTSAGFDILTYLSGASRVAAGVASGNTTTGFSISGDNAAANVYHVTMTLNLQDYVTNTWSFTVTGGLSSSAASIVGGGTKSLAGLLTQIRLTTVGGVDTFDGGSISYTYR
jgi:hypothetical protein